MKRALLCLAALSLLGLPNVKAQSNLGEIRGKVVDDATKKPLDFLNILVKREGINKGGSFTDEQGMYYIKALEPGTYTVIAKYQGYRDEVYEGVRVTSGQITFLNMSMRKDDGKQLKEFVKRQYRVPLVEGDKNKTSITDKEIKNLPTRSINSIANLSSAATQTAGGGISFLGSRTDGTAYFIDGVRVIGSVNVSQAAQGQIDIIQSGIPAQYGDFTGGAISITTKGPSRFYRNSFEVISSSPFNPYHFNRMEYFSSGPLKIKNRGGGDEEFVSIGYQVAGQFTYNYDPFASVFPTYQVKEDVLREIEEQPLVANPDGGGFVTRSSFLTRDDLEEVRAKDNVWNYGGNLQGKLEFQPNKNTTLTVFGSWDYSDRRNFNYTQQLMNWNENSQTIDQTFRTYVKFTQRLKSATADEKKDNKKSLISDAYYSVRLDYQTRNATGQNPRHGENIFDYGYLGRFTHYRAPVYSYIDPQDGQGLTYVDQNGDTVLRRGFFELSGFRDTLITFDASELNPARANYTQNLYDAFGARGLNITNELIIQQNLGLLNGLSVPNTYGLWTNPGSITANFSKSQYERFSAYAIGEATLNLKNKHDLEFGMFYEQTIASSYGINATGIWRLMTLLTNSHITNLDKVTSNNITFGGIHSYDEFGRFLDTVNYNVRVDLDQQKDFDRNLREKLISEGATDIYGNPITETSWINVNAMDPDDFSIDMFSANDLWNNGNSYVSYYGYDYKGNRTRGRPSINDFLNNEDDRAIGSFTPVYSAVWLQDKFAFKDLIFRLGVRIERYDANQPVLKDQYSLYPIYSAGEVTELNNLPVEHPNNVGDDYAVYVNNIENPTRILGYRDGNIWYDENGVEVTNPDFIAQQTSSGQIQPYLVDPQNQNVTEFSFADYDPQVNVLPRVWFSFPINTEAQFFANYDVLAQRPTDGAIFTPINRYYFLEATQGGFLPNANLRPRVRTMYELGFKQQLNDYSALSLIASYSETRNDFGQIRVNQAYPIQYITFANIDFTTVKSFRAEYELRGLNRISVRANYTLLFADGTGSNINSQAALIAANQPNLRSLFPLTTDIRHKIVSTINYSFKGGEQYSGPRWFGKDIFSNFTSSLIVNALSGAPYSAQAIATPEAQFGVPTRSQLRGNPFGSRLPWQFRVDANFIKAWDVEKKKTKDDFRAKSVTMEAYIWISNIFNSRIIQSVYGYTGLPTDDGYLNSPQGQQAIIQQINAQSFIDLYDVKVNNPFNFAGPRFTRAGLRMYF
jgi:hypothetical protein